MTRPIPLTRLSPGGDRRGRRGPAGYPFEVVQAKTVEQFDLVTPDKNMGRVSIEAWITLDQAKVMQIADSVDAGPQRWPVRCPLGSRYAM